jgi:hypothetical protein
VYQIDGIGFFALDSTFFWLIVIFSSFVSVFNSSGFGYCKDRKNYIILFLYRTILREINIIRLFIVFLFIKYPKDFESVSHFRESVSHFRESVSHFSESVS